MQGEEKEGEEGRRQRVLSEEAGGEIVNSSGDRTRERAGFLNEQAGVYVSGEKSLVQRMKDARSKMLAAEPAPKENRAPGIYVKNQIKYDCLKNTERGWNL